MEYQDLKFTSPLPHIVFPSPKRKRGKADYSGPLFGLDFGFIEDRFGTEWIFQKNEKKKPKLFSA